MQRRFSEIAHDLVVYFSLSGSKRLPCETVAEVCRSGGSSCVVVCGGEFETRRIATLCAQKSGSSSKCIFSEKEAKIVFPNGKIARFVPVQLFGIDKFKGSDIPLLIDTSASISLLRSLLIEGNPKVTFPTMKKTEFSDTKILKAAFAAMFCFFICFSMYITLSREEVFVKQGQQLERRLAE